jgi:hypothetical protein
MASKTEWDKGWQDGYDFAVKYFVQGFYRKEWPKNWGNGHYGSGYAEGQISGRSASLTRDFPNMVSYRSVRNGVVEIVFKDGSNRSIYKENGKYTQSSNNKLRSKWLVWPWGK